MSYLELLRLAAPEAIVILTALAVLAIGLTKSRVAGFCSGLAAAGLLFAAAARARVAARRPLSSTGCW